MWLAAVIIEPTYWCKWQSASIKIMHKHSKLCITVRICVFFSQYFLKNKYHHCDWWQTKYSNLHLRLFTAAFSYSFHIYCTYCSLNLLSFFKLTCKSFKMIVVWVLVCFSFNNAKWAQVHMDLFYLMSEWLRVCVCVCVCVNSACVCSSRSSIGRGWDP